MNQTKNIPDRKKIQQTVTNSRRHRQELAFASLQLEEVIVKLEQENRSRRIQHLDQVLTELI